MLWLAAFNPKSEIRNLESLLPARAYHAQVIRIIPLLPETLP